MAKTEPNPEELTGAKLCEITGLTDRRHRQLADEGFFPPPIKGIYQFTATLKGVVAYLREQAAKADSTMEEERLLKLKADRRMAELELQKRRKEALDADAVFSEWENVVTSIRQKLLALPSKISPRLSYINEQADIEAELEREMTEALLDLSKPMNYSPEEEDDCPDSVQAGDGQSAEAPAATD